MEINVTFLGTSDSTPTKKRNHSGFLLSWKNENILVDCGEGIQRQMKIADFNLCRITRILISHWHGDHVFGIPGLLSSLAMSEYSKKLFIYGPKGIKEKFAVMEKLYGRFGINYEVKEVSGKFLDEEDFFIQAEKMQHKINTNAYCFVVKDKLRINKDKFNKMNLPNSPLIKNLQKGKDIVLDGKKIKSKSLTYLEKGKKVCFVLDTAKNINAIKIAKDSDVLICEATFSSDEEKRAKDYGHLTSTQAGEIAKNSKSKKLFLTHISQRYEHDKEKILEQTRKVFKNSYLANDLSSIVI